MVLEEDPAVVPSLLLNVAGTVDVVFVVEMRPVVNLVVGESASRPTSTKRLASGP